MRCLASGPCECQLYRSKLQDRLGVGDVFGGIGYRSTATPPSVNWGKPLYAIAFILHKLKKYVSGPRPNRTVFRLVNDHDDIGIGLKPRLANNFVDAAFVVPIFHFIAPFSALKPYVGLSRQMLAIVTNMALQWTTASKLKEV